MDRKIVASSCAGFEPLDGEEEDVKGEEDGPGGE